MRFLFSLCKTVRRSDATIDLVGSVFLQSSSPMKLSVPSWTHDLAFCAEPPTYVSIIRILIGRPPHLCSGPPSPRSGETGDFHDLLCTQ